LKKRIIIFLFFLAVYSNALAEQDTSFKECGSSTSNKAWIYLCGLTAHFIPECMEELQALDAVGKLLDIKFLAMVPKSRSCQFNNRLYWPHDTEEELLKTYQEIVGATHSYAVQGYIGFSNGGFFLNKLAQFIKVDKPIISIGSAGPLYNRQGPHNSMYLLIGKEDKWHYEHTVNLHEHAKNTHLTIHLIEYNEGHKVPEKILQELIQELS